MGPVEAIDELASMYPPRSAVIVTEILAQPRGECQPSKPTLRYETKFRGLSKFVAIVVTFSFGAQDLLQNFGPTKRQIQDERENPTWGRVPLQPNQGRHDPT
jgi:hypothetical protein